MVSLKTQCENKMTQSIFSNLSVRMCLFCKRNQHLSDSVKSIDGQNRICCLSAHTCTPVEEDAADIVVPDGGFLGAGSHPQRSEEEVDQDVELVDVPAVTHGGDRIMLAYRPEIQTYLQNTQFEHVLLFNTLNMFKQ